MHPKSEIGENTIYCDDCLNILPLIPDQSVDAIITDPPYPEIDRPYGRITEQQWWDLMMGVCRESRRILKPSGSAVFILQPNSRVVGSMRGWLWKFMAWACDEWNMVQDFWWWNHAAMPTIHCNRDRGLARPSVKACVWIGSEDCYRRQEEVLWTQSDANKAIDRSNRALRNRPSGVHVRYGRCASVADERGGVTPFNLLPIASADSSGSSGAKGHGAGTPLDVADWWTRYICPPGGLCLDPFCGAGTMPVAAIRTDRRWIGIEQHAAYVEIARQRIKEEEDKIAARDYMPLFAGLTP